MTDHITAADQWREKAAAVEEVVALELPSGMVIQARRPGPMQFAAWDRLPMLLGLDGAPGGAGSTEEAVEVTGFLRDLLVHCCVAPRVSMTPGPGEIAPREIPEADWTRIVRWAMRLEEADAVRRFRRQRAHDGGSGGGENVFAQTFGTDGDRGPGTGAGVRPGGVPAVDRGDEGRGGE